MNVNEVSPHINLIQEYAYGGKVFVLEDKCCKHLGQDRFVFSKS